MDISKTGRRTIAAVLAMGALSTTSYAATRTQQNDLTQITQAETMPRWTNVSSLSADISNDGKTLYPEVYVRAYSSSHKITGTMYLEKWNGSSWKSVSSWTFSGTESVSLSKSYNGIPGTEYRTHVVITINGERAVSSSQSCMV